MKKIKLKQVLLFILAAFLVIPAGYFALTHLWYYFQKSPGLDIRDGSHDRGRNGIWMQHGWIGDVSWFKKYHKDPVPFHDPNRLKELATLLKKEHITDLYPHLCPCGFTGAIPPVDDAQTERFLDAFENVRVMPWVGGIFPTDTLLWDKKWRDTFTKSCVNLLVSHPRLAGIHVDIEPVASGDQGFLALLRQLKNEMPAGKLLSVSGYHPSTLVPLVTEYWSEDYSRSVAAIVDQAAVMLYDSAISDPATYRGVMKDWTKQVLDWYGTKEVLIGVPAFEESSVSHYPGAESLQNAFLGVHAGLGRGEIPKAYRGVSIYCEWTMTSDKWKAFESMYRSK